MDELRLDAYMDLNAILLCYDITNAKSFENLKFWLKEIKDSFDHMFMMVVGLKNDKKANRVVKERDVAGFVKDHRMLFKDCSAKSGENIKEIAQDLAATLAK